MHHENVSEPGLRLLGKDGSLGAHQPVPQQFY